MEEIRLDSIFFVAIAFIMLLLCLFFKISTNGEKKRLKAELAAESERQRKESEVKNERFREEIETESERLRKENAEYDLFMRRLKSCSAPGNYRIKIESMPKSQFGKNLRRYLSQESWDKIRLDSLKEYSNICPYCGEKLSERAFEAHEVWEYDDDLHLQRLVGVVPVDRPCHLAHHIGIVFKESADVREKVINRIKGINYVTDAEWKKDEERLKLSYTYRNAYIWKQDYSWLKNHGYDEFYDEVIKHGAEIEK